LLSKQYEVFVCSRAAGSHSCTCWSVFKLCLSNNGLPYRN